MLCFASSRINSVTYEIFASCQGSSRIRSSPPSVCTSYPGLVCPPFLVTLTSVCPMRWQDWSVASTCLSWVTPSPVIPRRWNGVPLPKHPREGHKAAQSCLLQTTHAQAGQRGHLCMKCGLCRWHSLHNCLPTKGPQGRWGPGVSAQSYHKRVAARILLGWMPLLRHWKCLWHSPHVKQRDWVASTNLFGSA